MLCFILVNSVLFNPLLFGSCFGMLAVILVSDLFILSVEIYEFLAEGA